jgi:hypothetical protein
MGGLKKAPVEFVWFYYYELLLRFPGAANKDSSEDDELYVEL